MGEHGGAAGVSRPWLERVLDVVRELGTSADLQEALNRIAQAVVDVVEFDAAAINVTVPGGQVRVDAVVGPPELEDLLGRSTSVQDWELLLAGSQPWGSLRFHSHAEDQEVWDAVASWRPDGHHDGPPDAWHPDDSLFAPMRSADGGLLGVISVDLPRSGRAPDAEQRTVLELFAAQAAAAIADADRRDRLSDQEMLFRTVFAGAPAPSVIVDAELEVVAANRAFARVVSSTPDDLRGVPLLSLVDPDDAERVAAACTTALAGVDEEADVEHRLRTTRGTLLWASTRVGRLESLVSGTSLVLNVEDVTETRRTLEELRFRAEHDVLTGLPNRRVAHLGLRRALAALPGGAVAVLGCDVDGFKQVNDVHGHLVGDQLLVLIAQRLRTALAPDDLLCRHGGDEFLVVATVQEPAQAEGIAQRCVDALAGPFDVSGTECVVSLSVGVAVATAAAEPVGLLERADAALYRAKDLGKGRWHRDG